MALVGLGESPKWLIVAVGVVACGGESRSISRSEAAAGSESGGTGGTGGSSDTGGSGGAGAVGGTGGSSATGAAGGTGGSIGTGAEGGTGGSSGTGGSETGGIGGESVAPIDDMEGNDELQLPPGSFYWGRALGFWFYSTSEVIGDAATEDIDPPRGDSKRAYRITDEGLIDGMDLWAQLDHPNNRSFDLSAYAGITFWARLETPSGRLVVALMDGTPYFGAKANGEDIRSVTLEASPEWQRFVIPFDAFGESVTSASSIDFIAGIGGEPFDLWIDDLAFVCNGPCVESD
jgi:hypothetical protein